MRVDRRRDAKWDGRPCKRAGEHNDAERTFRSYLDAQAGMAFACLVRVVVDSQKDARGQG